MNRFLLALATLLAFATSLVVAPRTANAHPWMIRDAYTGCATCHADPSGAGLLTAYGRAQSELLLSAFPQVAAEEPSRASRALFGVFPESDWLLYSIAYRGALFASKTANERASARTIQMQADFRAQATFGERFRVNGSIGFVPAGGQLAAVLPDSAFQLVSREHWVGVDLGESRDILLRAGRIAIPYGLRGNEHPMWVRTSTRTDIASNQQHGVALSRTAVKYRTEIMALLGNYQIAPDLYRERGYAGFYEHVLAERMTLGVSSLVTHAEGDLFRSRRKPLTRQAHGVFARWSASKALVLLGQADLVARHPSGKDTEVGTAFLVQADLQVARGIHLLPAIEAQKPRFDQGGLNAGTWLSLAFFPYAHVETRLDLVGRSVDTAGGRIANVSALLALHLYL